MVPNMRHPHIRRQAHAFHGLLAGLVLAQHASMDMRKALGRAIRDRRNAMGFTQPQLAAASGVDQSSISRYERGLEQPPIDKLERIAGALDAKISTLWLEADGLADIAAVPRAKAPAMGIRYVPLISWVQAGQWAEIVDTFQRETAEPIPTSARVSPKSYALEVHGPSMTNPGGSRSFPHGTRIIVDPARAVENGSLVIVRLENEVEATFKQLVSEGRRSYLKPLNPQFQAMEVDRPAVFCGVVVSIAETEV